MKVKRKCQELNLVIDIVEQEEPSIYTNPPSIATSDTFPYFVVLWYSSGREAPHVKFFRRNVGFAPTTNYRKVRLSAL